MIDAWHRARDHGGDAELEYGDRHPECVIEFPQSGEVFDLHRRPHASAGDRDAP